MQTEGTKHGMSITEKWDHSSRFEVRGVEEGVETQREEACKVK